MASAAEAGNIPVAAARRSLPALYKLKLIGGLSDVDILLA